MAHGMAEELSREDREFLKERAPRLLQVIKEAEERSFDEVLKEAIERVSDLQEEWEEAREDGEKWAGLMVGEMANEAALDYLVWKFEEGEIEEGQAEETLRDLMEERWRIDNGITEREMKMAAGNGDADLAAELAEELQWRMGNPLKAVNEMIADFMEQLEEMGGEDQEEEEEVAGEIYTPPPLGGQESESVLEKVAFQYEKHIVVALETYCFDCHDSSSAKGDLDLEKALLERPLVRNRLLWENVAERIRSGDMPPKNRPQPAAEDRLRLRAWLRQEIEHFPYEKIRDPGYAPARRLTREEYNRTIRDLVGLDLRPADHFPVDFSGSSGFSNSSNTLFLATAHLDRYLTAAEEVIDTVRNLPQAWAALKGDGGSDESLGRFARLAFRKTPGSRELEELRRHLQIARDTGQPEDDALATAFKLVLISPHFLLRVEKGGKPGIDEKVAATDLASRLSYFLWASSPDEKLLGAAESGLLGEKTGRENEITRMLSDDRSLALGEVFAGEWLGTHKVGPRIRKDPIDNPWCTESLMKAMRDETALFIHSLIRENAPVERMINARYTFLNEELARFYGIPGVDGDAMRRVTLQTPRRGGLLGHASILAATSFPDRTSPVVRGTWILTTLLGTPPPPPPPNVPEIEGGGRGRNAVRNLREQLEVHRRSERCAGCHSRIDPLGFALENYAEFGQWRPNVDNRGALPNGARFRGPEGLKIALREWRLDDLGMQVIRKMMAYGLGRQLEYYDEGTVREIAARLKPSGYLMRDMVKEVVESRPFLMRRLPVNTEPALPSTSE